MISETEVLEAAGGASLDFLHLDGAMRDPIATVTFLSSDLLPTFGIRWPAPAVNRIGSRRLNALLFLCVVRPIQRNVIIDYLSMGSDLWGGGYPALWPGNHGVL